MKAALSGLAQAGPLAIDSKIAVKPLFESLCTRTRSYFTQSLNKSLQLRFEKFQSLTPHCVQLLRPEVDLSIRTFTTSSMFSLSTLVSVGTLYGLSYRYVEEATQLSRTHSETCFCELDIRLALLEDGIAMPFAVKAATQFWLSLSNPARLNRLETSF